MSAPRTCTDCGTTITRSDARGTRGPLPNRCAPHHKAHRAAFMKTYQRAWSKENREDELGKRIRKIKREARLEARR